MYIGMRMCSKKQKKETADLTLRTIREVRVRNESAFDAADVLFLCHEAD